MATNNTVVGKNLMTTINAGESVASLNLSDSATVAKTYKISGNLITSNVPGSETNGLDDDEVLPSNTGLEIEFKAALDKTSQLRGNGVPDVVGMRALLPNIMDSMNKTGPSFGPALPFPDPAGFNARTLFYDYLPAGKTGYVGFKWVSPEHDAFVGFTKTNAMGPYTEMVAGVCVGGGDPQHIKTVHLLDDPFGDHGAPVNGTSYFVKRDGETGNFSLVSTTDNGATFTHMADLPGNEPGLLYVTAVTYQASGVLLREAKQLGLSQP